jgi:hypothetical protein
VIALSDTIDTCCSTGESDAFSDPDFVAPSLSPSQDSDFVTELSRPTRSSELRSEFRLLIRDQFAMDRDASQRLIDKYLASATPKGWCALSVQRPSKNYVQVSTGGANHFAVLQEVLLWSRGVQKMAGEDCSHLCHNPRCCVAEHVVAESSLNNQRRKGCPVWVDCPHPGVCGGKKFFICQHSPACIKYCEGYQDQAEFLAGGICSWL